MDLGKRKELRTVLQTAWLWVLAAMILLVSS